MVSTLLVTQHIQFNTPISIRFPEGVAFVMLLFSLTYSEQDFGVMFSEINFQRDESKPFRGGSGQAAAYFGTVKQEFAWTLRFMI